MQIKSEQSVDSGSIVLTSMEYLKQLGAVEKYKNRPDLGLKVNLAPGIYKVAYKIEGTWVDDDGDLGEVSGEEIIETKEGIFFGDPCYSFREYVPQIYKPEEGRCISTGGDGTFTCKVQITKIELS